MPRHTYESVKAEIARLQRLAKQIENRHAAKQQRARRKVLAFMKKLGVSLEDLLAAKSARAAAPKPRRARKGAAAKKAKAVVSKRRGKKVPIKYRGPKRGDTWTGRGKPPRWLAAQIAEGKKREDFLIK